jgi:hypothetical protein
MSRGAGADALAAGDVGLDRCAPEGLSGYDPGWEQVRSDSTAGRVFDDGSLLLATDFEGGNGADFRRLGPAHYFMRLERDPGTHPFSGKSYYFNVGMRNRETLSRTVRLRLEAFGWNYFGAQTGHVVVRRGGRWSHLDPSAIHPADGEADTADIDVPLPGAGEPDPVLFVSNYHWWPYSEMVRWLHGLPSGRARVREIGRSFQGRALYAVELGRTDAGAPAIVQTQTPQPSEMGSLTCKALIDFLCSDHPEAAALLARFRFGFVPMTNPDGTVLGYVVSDAQGRFAFLEGHLAAAGDSSATPETVAVWRYLDELRPWLFWEWHSNNWSRRSGHMLIRYRHELMADEGRRRLWDRLEERLLELPDTVHENWTSYDEGPYQKSMGFQAVTRLGIISTMIKHHDRFPLEVSQRHAVECLKIAGAVYAG